MCKAIFRSGELEDVSCSPAEERNGQETVNKSRLGHNPLTSQLAKIKHLHVYSVTIATQAK